MLLKGPCAARARYYNLLLFHVYVSNECDFLCREHKQAQFHDVRKNSRHLASGEPTYLNKKQPGGCVYIELKTVFMFYAINAMYRLSLSPLAPLANHAYQLNHGRRFVNIN